jgi:thioredoxin 1
MVIEITADNFKQEVLDSPIPVLIDFWATWCMPCQMVAPVVEAIAQEYTGKLKVGKVDVDKQGELAAKYSVLSIPAMLFFKNGQVVDTVVGAVPKGFLVDRINKITQ